MDFIINFGLLRQIPIIRYFFANYFPVTLFWGEIPILKLGFFEREETLYKIHDFVKIKDIQKNWRNFS